MIEQSPVVSGPQNIGTGYGYPFVSANFSGYGYSAADLITALDVSNLRHENAENRADIREAISNSSMAVLERLSDNKEQSLKANFENRLETKQVFGDLRTEMLKGFCELNDRFSSLERRDLEATVGDLKDRVNALSQSEQTAKIVEAIKAINCTPKEE